MSIVQQSDWKRFITRHPEAHILQSDEWGKLKSSFNWDAKRLIVGNTGALVLFKQLPLGFSIAYIPKGPVGDDWNSIWSEVDELCVNHKAVFLKIEPDLWESIKNREVENIEGFRKSNQTIQPRNTIVINLNGSESDWLMCMKQKTRYNIRLAQRKGVKVEYSDDLELFHRMIEVTAHRDKFGVHTYDYYQRAYNLFYPAGNSELLVAKYNDMPLSAIMLFVLGKRAWYFYGASNNLERSRMPTYLLQWEAMRWAARKGCLEYDLWGIPDERKEVLEENFLKRSDGLWGVYRFKRGFGGELRRSTGAWDRIYHPRFYSLYLSYLKMCKINSY